MRAALVACPPQHRELLDQKARVRARRERIEQFPRHRVVVAGDRKRGDAVPELPELVLNGSWDQILPQPDSRLPDPSGGQWRRVSGCVASHLVQHRHGALHGLSRLLRERLWRAPDRTGNAAKAVGRSTAHPSECTWRVTSPGSASMLPSGVPPAGCRPSACRTQPKPQVGIRQERYRQARKSPVFWTAPLLVPGMRTGPVGCHRAGAPRLSAAIPRASEPAIGTDHESDPNTLRSNDRSGTCCARPIFRPPAIIETIRLNSVPARTRPGNSPTRYLSGPGPSGPCQPWPSSSPSARWSLGFSWPVLSRMMSRPDGGGEMPLRAIRDSTERAVDMRFRRVPVAPQFLAEIAQSALHVTTD